MTCTSISLTENAKQVRRMSPLLVGDEVEYLPPLVTNTTQEEAQSAMNKTGEEGQSMLNQTGEGTQSLMNKDGKTLQNINLSSSSKQTFYIIFKVHLSLVSKNSGARHSYAFIHSELKA